MKARRHVSVIECSSEVIIASSITGDNMSLLYPMFRNGHVNKIAWLDQVTNVKYVDKYMFIMKKGSCSCSLEENLSMTTICYDLAIVTHAEKMHE